MSDDILLNVQELLESAQASLKTANALLRDMTGVSDTSRERHSLRATRMSSSVSGKMVEGVFDVANFY
jgi:hypothetical protein